MFKDRFVKVMLVVIALLLVANLAQTSRMDTRSQKTDGIQQGLAEQLFVRQAFAASSEPVSMPPAAISGAGGTTWILIGNQLFYAKVDNYNRIEIFGPERLKY